jgi:DNA-binding CsgD family transcriptional regulator
MTTPAERHAQTDQRRTEARRLLVEENLSYNEIGRRLEVSAVTIKKYCRGLPAPNNAKSGSSRAVSRMNPRNNEADAATRAEQAFDLRLRGLSNREIARQMKVDPKTVRNWIDNEIEARVAPGVAKLRVIMNAELAEMKVQAWAIVAQAAGTELALKGIDRLLQIARREAALNGADSPVRVEVTSVEKSQADLELEELLREAQARNAVIEAEIVDGEVVDTPPPAIEARQ